MIFLSSFFLIFFHIWKYGNLRGESTRSCEGRSPLALPSWPRPHFAPLLVQDTHIATSTVDSLPPSLLKREDFPAWRQIVGFLPARDAWGSKRCTGAFALLGCFMLRFSRSETALVCTPGALCLAQADAWPSRGSLHAIYCVYEQVAYADCECPLLGSFGLRNFEMLPLRVFIFAKSLTGLRAVPSILRKVQ